MNLTQEDQSSPIVSKRTICIALGAGARPRHEAFKVITLCLSFKALVLVTVATFSFLGLIHFPEEVLKQGLPKWPSGDTITFWTPFATWDSAHYLSLAEKGYQPGFNSNAFYPLWPTLLRGLSIATGGGTLFWALLMANIFSAFGLGVFYRIVSHLWSAKIGFWAVICLTLFPGAVYYQFPYSESLFFLLLMILWYGHVFRRPFLCGLAGLLLPLTRAIGIFAILPLGFNALHLICGSRWSTMIAPLCSKPLQSEKPCASIPVALALTCTPLVGYCVYLSAMWSWTGNPFEGFRAQASWGAHSIGNLINLPGFIGSLFTPERWHAFQGSYVDRVVFIACLFSIPWLWANEKQLLVWMIWLILIPAMSGNFTSFLRFAACGFPLFVAMGAFLAQLRSPLKALICTFLLLAHLVCLWRLVSFYWVG